MKKAKISDDKLNRIIKYLVIILLGLSVIFVSIQFDQFWKWIFSALKVTLVPIIFAYFTSLIVFPLIKYLEKKGIGPRWFTLSIVFVLLVGFIFAGFYYIGPRVVSEITDFFNRDFQTIMTYLQTDLRDDFIFGTNLYDQIYAYITETDAINVALDNAIPAIIGSLTNSLIPILASTLLIPILLIYYLKDYEKISESIRSLIPKKQEKSYAELGFKLNQTVGAYLRGQLFLMISLGVVATLVYRIIGLKYYVAFGLLVGITNIIPYFGMLMAALPPIIYTFIASNQPDPIAVLGVNIVLQFFEGNFFQPLIIGHHLSMHPIVIIISILFFGSLFGGFGVIFASPIAASIRVFYNFSKKRKKEKLKLTQPEGNSP